MGSKIKLRRKMLPKTWVDLGAFMFITLLITVFYFFELSVVLPAFYPEGSLWHMIHFICASFLMINVTGNFAAAVCTDSSIATETLPTVLAPGWRHCAVCETMSPPRSWHCPTCDTCILKRDHHCNFMGCCIGHYNHRYFFMFVFYTFISAVYGAFFNTIFLWNFFDFDLGMTMFKLIFPPALFVSIFFLESTTGDYFLVMYMFNVTGIVVPGVLSYLQICLISEGRMQHEKEKRMGDYDFGFKRNITQVFGQRWYIAWLFPFISSELPLKGIDWTADSFATEPDKIAQQEFLED